MCPSRFHMYAVYMLWHVTGTCTAHVGYLKVDNCWADQSTVVERYRTMGTALRNAAKESGQGTGEIVFSLCSWGVGQVSLWTHTHTHTQDACQLHIRPIARGMGARMQKHTHTRARQHTRTHRADVSSVTVAQRGHMCVYVCVCHAALAWVGQGGGRSVMAHQSRRVVSMVSVSCVCVCVCVTRLGAVFTPGSCAVGSP